jgi:uncharacterized repeat protein (TIGR01451 family)
MRDRFKPGLIKKVVRPGLFVVALVAAVALIVFLPRAADARQPVAPARQGSLPGATQQAGSGASDPFYAEVFAPIKDDVHIKIPYQSLKTWDPASDESVDHYANVPAIQQSVIRKTANIPRVMGIQNYDNPDATNNINTKQSGPTYFYDRQIFEGWNFIDEYVTFGWGPISVPSPQETTIAHKNGLPVIATVDFGDDSYLQDARDLIEKTDGKLWAVDKLVQMADTFHFDGWFFNMELSLGSADQVQSYKDLIAQLSQRTLKSGKRLIVVWYDSMNASGYLAYDGLTKAVADTFFLPVTEGRFFMDYRNFYGFAKARTNAGTRANDVFMGVNWWEWSQSGNAFEHIKALSDDDNGKPAWEQLSMGLWAIGFPTLGNNLKYDPNPVSAKQIHQYVENYWWNADAKPDKDLQFDSPKIPVNDQGKAVADYHQRTAVTTLPFTTTFNLGKGDRYFQNGKLVSDAPWGNLIEQDVLPNYLARANGVKVDLDFSDAFSGGTSLKAENSAAQDFAQDVPVYLANIENRSVPMGAARVTYKNGGTGTSEFYLKFANGRYSKGQLAPTGGDWKEIEVPSVDGQALVEMGMSRVAAGSSVSLGRIQLVGRTHLEATMYADPGAVPAGGTITYTTAITNTGEADAGGVTFSDAVPGDTSIVRGSLRCSDKGAVLVSGSPVLVSGMTIKARDTVTVEFAATVSKDKKSGTVVSNQGHVGYSGMAIPTSSPEHPGKGLPTIVKVQGGLDPGSQEWLIAEGSTGGGFDTWVLLQNPGTSRASVTVSFTTEAGRARPLNLFLAGGSRASIRVADYVPDMWQVSTVIKSDRPIVAERSTYWDKTRVGESDRAGSPAPYEMRGGHSELGVPVDPGDTAPRGSYVNYFAEGATAGAFDTWILLSNPNQKDAEAKITLMTEHGEATERRLLVRANSRATIHLDEHVPDSYHVATEVLSDEPLVAERSVYWDPDAPAKQPWQMMGGSSTSGVTTPGTRWFLAEGSTGGGFETFLLLLNPNEKKVTAHVDFSDPTGIIKTKLVDIPARSRVTLKTEDYAPDNFSVATRVLSSEPIVAERSTYWDRRSSSELNRMRDGHASAGTASAGHTWLVPEGSTAGGFDSWVLVANVSPVATRAKVTFMGIGGKIKSADVTIPAQARYSLHLNDYVPGQSGVSTLIESNGSLVVERAMYWDRNETKAPYEMMGGNSANGVQP